MLYTVAYLWARFAIFYLELKMKSAQFVVTLFVISVLPLPLASQGKKGSGGSGSSNSSNTQNATPSGQSASSTATIESQMLAYGGLDLVSPAIADSVCGNVADNSTVVIFDQTTFGNIQAYEAFVAGARALVEHYASLSADEDAFRDKLQARANEHAERAAATAANAANEQVKSLGHHMESTWKVRALAIGLSTTIDPFSDATSLLSAIAIASNTETGGTIVMPDSAVAVALSRDLRTSKKCQGKGLTVIYPPLFGKASTSDFSSGDIQSILQTIEDARNIIQAEIVTVNDTFIAAHSTATAGNPTIATMLGDVNGLYDSFLNSFLQVNSSTGTVGMAALVQGYQLASLLAGRKNPPDPKDPNKDTGYEVMPANILLASVLGAAGTEHTHKNIWTALWKGDEITYSGGLIVNMSLWQATAKTPSFSKIFRYRMPYSDVKPPKNEVNVTDGDNIH